MSILVHFRRSFMYSGAAIWNSLPCDCDICK